MIHWNVIKKQVLKYMYLNNLGELCSAASFLRNVSLQVEQLQLGQHGETICIGSEYSLHELCMKNCKLLLLYPAIPGPIAS